MQKKLIAEFFGTFWLVLGGCGSALISAGFPDLGIGFLGVALAFGLTVLTMAYAVGPISGGHFNPAVTIGMWAGGRFHGQHIVPYILAQVAGALLAATVLYFIVTGNGSGIGDFAANGYGEHSPGKYDLPAAFLTEALLTFMFLFVIQGTTHERAPKGFAGLAIGLTLTLILLISIPVTNSSVNPARSISQAVFVGGWALEQLWLFLVAPVLGALLSGWTFKALLAKENEPEM